LPFAGSAHVGFVQQSSTVHGFGSVAHQDSQRIGKEGGGGGGDKSGVGCPAMSPSLCPAHAHVCGGSLSSEGLTVQSSTPLTIAQHPPPQSLQSPPGYVPPWWLSSVPSSHIPFESSPYEPQNPSATCSSTHHMLMPCRQMAGGGGSRGGVDGGGVGSGAMGGSEGGGGVKGGEKGGSGGGGNA